MKSNNKKVIYGIFTINLIFLMYVIALALKPVVSQNKPADITLSTNTSLSHSSNCNKFGGLPSDMCVFIANKG